MLAVDTVDMTSSDNQLIFKQLGIKIGINSPPFAIFVTQNKGKMSLRECFGTLCSG